VAKTYGCKYMEVSAILNHKVDELLVSSLKQIRLCSGGGGRPRRAGDPAGGRGALWPGDGERSTETDDCSADSTTTTSTTTAAAASGIRSRSPGLLSRLIRAASPRRS